MGIAISSALLLAVFLLVAPSYLTSKQHKFCSLLVLILGLWNVFWYGLSHWVQFWGIVALQSGLLMMLASAISLLTPQWLSSISAERNALFRAFRWSLIFLLSTYFLLYSVTIIRLNLGYSILS